MKARKNMKKSKNLLFVIGVAIVVCILIFFGYIICKAVKLDTALALSYTDEIVVEDGISTIKYSSVEFANENAKKCMMKVKWGSIDEYYPFISMVKIIAPSGKVIAWVTGDSGDFDLAFDLPEKGTYKIKSEYFFDADTYCEEVNRIWPEEKIEPEEDGSIDGFVFDSRDGEWLQCYEVSIVTSR